MRRVPFEKARAAAVDYSFLDHYVDALDSVVDLRGHRRCRDRIGADPLGGIRRLLGGDRERCLPSLEVVNPTTDPAFGFATLDTDGKIRMDCSSP